MSSDMDTAKAIIERLMPHGITVCTGFDNVMGIEICATKHFSINATDYMNLLANPKMFADRVRSELGMLHPTKRVIQRVSNINSDYWVSSPSARRRR